MQQDASQTPAAAQPAVVSAPGGGSNAAAMSQMGFHDLIQNFDVLGWIVFITLCVMSISSIYFVVANFLRNGMIRARMEKVIDHVSVAWQDREKIWLGVFVALRISSAITVSSIILISGLGMFNTLAMIVLEKTREISILRSMGYTRRDISRIFIPL